MFLGQGALSRFLSIPLRLCGTTAAVETLWLRSWFRIWPANNMLVTVFKYVVTPLRNSVNSVLTLKQWSAGLPDPDAAFNRMWLRPIQLGLTKPRPNRMDKFKHKTADMCIPILPTTDHPLGRTPLPISHPLPWSNCYQPTIDDFDVLVEPQNYEYSDTPRFSSATDSAVHRYTSEDVKRINAMEAECSIGPLGVQDPVVNNNTSDSDSIESVGDYAPSLSDDINAVENTLFSSVNAPMWSKIFTPAIKFNSDLGVIKVLSDPVELWDEHALLKQ